jgi:hypothetical protein
MPSIIGDIRSSNCSVRPVEPSSNCQRKLYTSQKDHATKRSEDISQKSTVGFRSDVLIIL